MKAQVLHKYDPEMKEKVWVTEQEMPDPKLEKSSDVIVKIGAAGVCRTDLHIVEGVWKHIQDPNGDLLPMVMGHENAGWVEEVGKDVTGFKKGDPVILHPIISGTDGTCLNCRRGLDQYADDVAFPGLNIKEGGYAELLKTSVRNLINTNHFERPFHPEIGGNVRALLFEPMTPLTALNLQRKVEEVLNNFEPRAKITQIIADPDIDRNAYRLEIKFYVIGVQNPITVETFLERLR